jgi:hypothetical protein
MSVNRLLGLFRYARSDELEVGFFWYDVAALDIVALAASYDYPYGVAAGVVSALSPACRWDINLYDADNVLATVAWGGVLEDIKVSTYNRNRDKAINIALTREVFPSLRGPKVVAFYQCLCGDYSEPAVDSHAINAWAGRRIAGSNLGSTSRPLVRRVRADYVRAAELVKVEPARFQAVIWCVHKRRVLEGKVS